MNVTHSGSAHFPPPYPCYGITSEQEALTLY